MGGLTFDRIFGERKRPPSITGQNSISGPGRLGPAWDANRPHRARQPHEKRLHQAINKRTPAMRDEVLNLHQFTSLAEAQIFIKVGGGLQQHTQPA